MELPFYLRILPSEALEVLAYYRRRGSNVAYADAIATATGLSDRGFGKAIRRLVTKGYLVLDGDQRYRLTEHGQRAVDDLPASMAGGDDFDPEEAGVPDSDVERVPVDSSDNFDSLFDDDAAIDDLDSLFDAPDEPVEVDIEASAAQFLADEPDEATLIANLFEEDEGEDEDDDLFADMDDEDAAAFNDLFGEMEEVEETPEPVSQARVETVEAPRAETTPDDASDDDTGDTFEPSWLDSLAAVPAVLAQAAVAGTDDDGLSVEASEAGDESEDEPVSLFETLAEEHHDAFAAPPLAQDDDPFATPAGDQADTLAEQPAGDDLFGVPASVAAELDEASDDLFEWLEMDDDGVEDFSGLWDDAETPDTGWLTEAAQPGSDDDSASRIVGRRLVVALPHPLVAEQPAHITIGILPDDSATLAEPVQLMVRLSVVNGEPSRAAELPLLLTNGVTRQDVTITPGRYNQVRLRLRVYQLSDASDEVISCGGMYVDADVVEESASQTPIAYGVDTHFYIDA